MKKLLFCSLILISTQLFASGPGTVKWSIPLNAPNLTSPTLSDDGNMLYIGSTNSQLLALDAMNGTQKWQYQFSGGIYSPVAYDGDTQTIYVTTNADSQSQTGGIYALNANTGALINLMTTRGAECQYGKPTRADYLVTGATDKPVGFPFYCTANGVEYSAIAEFSASSPEFTPNLAYEQTPYDPSQFDSYRKKEITFDRNPNLEGILTTSYGSLYEDPEESIGPALADWNVLAGQGSLASARFWQGNIIPNITFSTPTYDETHQLIYVGGSDGNLYAYGTGSRGLNVAPAFVLQLGGDLSLNPPAIGFAGRFPGVAIYITSTNGFLYAIDVTTGTVMWSTHLSNAGFASRPTIDGIVDGTPLIYAVDKAGILYGTLDEETSPTPEYWSPIQNLQISSMSTSIGYDGFNHLLYLTSSNGTLSAFIGTTS